MPLSAIQRLSDLIALPTLASAPTFEGMVERTGWETSQQETFDRITQYFKDWLGEFADEIGEQPVQLGEVKTANLWARTKGQDESRAVLLQGHFDVVDASGNFQPEINENRLYGRGTSDMKGGLVAAIQAVQNLIERDERPATDVYILLTCEEEVVAKGAYSFADNPPAWIEKVKFCICLEAGYSDEALQFSIQHPGAACVLISRRVEAMTSTDDAWRIYIETGRQQVRHASRQPLTLDPNAIMLSLLNELSVACVASLHSDRPITGEANSTAYFSEAVIFTDRSQRDIAEILHEIASAYISEIPDAERREQVREDFRYSITIEQAGRGFHAPDFMQPVLAFRQHIKRGYSNVLFDAPPFTISTIVIQDGWAQIKIDMRTDDALCRDLPDLVERQFPKPFETKILWNDPALANPDMAENPMLLKLRGICEQYRSVNVSFSTGWTEASVWSSRLNIPTVITGPGTTSVIHTAEEYIALAHLEETIKILEAFLSHYE